MLRHQYVDLFEVRDAKWKNEEKNMNVSALFSFFLYSSGILFGVQYRKDICRVLGRGGT